MEGGGKQHLQTAIVDHPFPDQLLCDHDLLFYFYMDSSCLYGAHLRPTHKGLVEDSSGGPLLVIRCVTWITQNKPPAMRLAVQGQQ